MTDALPIRTALAEITDCLQAIRCECDELVRHSGVAKHGQAIQALVADAQIELQTIEDMTRDLIEASAADPRVASSTTSTTALLDPDPDA